MAILTAAELRNLGKDELLEKLGNAKEELFNLRFQAATGQLESHGRLRAVRKDIARIYTVLTERALGITEEVDSAPVAEAEAEADAETEATEVDEAVSDQNEDDSKVEKAGSKA